MNEEKYTIEERTIKLLRKNIAKQVFDTLNDYGVILHMDYAFQLTEYEYDLFNILCHDNVQIKENGLITPISVNEKEKLDTDIRNELKVLYNIKEIQTGKEYNYGGF